MGYVGRIRTKIPAKWGVQNCRNDFFQTRSNIIILCYLNSIMSAKSCKTALEAASDGIEFPLTVVSVKLTNNDGCLNREILAQVVMNHLCAGCLIYKTDIGIGNLSRSSDVLASAS